MKIPKYIENMIIRRKKLAEQLDLVSYELDSWLDKNKIECETCDTHTGVEIYCNPSASAERVRQAILNKE